MTSDPWMRTTYADGCGVCLEHVVEPSVQLRDGNQMCCLYECPCGWKWQCNWLITAVTGWDVLGEDAAAWTALTTRSTKEI